ncbi:DUF397 domain-containing protein [Streptomyces vilmorinianum]|nr:DUF397 domain-containing protein [Streptomyces vilmorinianum]
MEISASDDVLGTAVWFTSSYSGVDGGNCLEAAWAEFVGGVRAAR